MKTISKNKIALFWISLTVCIINAATVLAQPIEIVVTGGGFTILGPSELSFAAQPFSFADQISVVNFADIAGKAPNYIQVTDLNGGSAFSVALGAEDLTPGGSGICNADNCIPKANLAIRNNDGASPEIELVEGSISHVSLDPSTNFTNDPPASLNQQRVLLNGTGQAPGIWNIYPQLQETTPGNTAIGNYLGTITITIMTN